VNLAIILILFVQANERMFRLDECGCGRSTVGR